MKPKKTVLFSDYSIAPPNEAQKNAFIRAMGRRAAPVARGTTLPSQMATQFSYIGLWFWLGLAAVLGALLYLFSQLPHITWGAQGLQLSTLALLAAAGPLLASLAAPVLARSYSHDMWELEEAAYHNLPRLTALRMMVCALAALPVIGILAVAGSFATGFLLCAGMVLGPFLLASGVNYFILGRLRGSAGSLCCVGACLVLAFVVAMPFGQPRLVLPIVQSGVAAAAILLPCAAVFALGARRYIKSTLAK